MQRHTQLADRLHSAAIHVLRSVREADAESGLSPARLSVLSVLVFGGPITIGELAAAEQVRPPTMTRLVDGLVTDRLAAREAAEDRRSCVVRATSRGTKLLHAARQRRVARLTRGINALKAEEREVLGRAASIMERVATAPRRKVEEH
jgi:DNA-binding MarR family transcriptional regulator